jgi:phosphatidylinositol alpha-1,6-mannosyltransferase
MANAHSSIFILTHEFAPRRGGIATFTEEMARAASALGHPVEVWAQALPPNISPEAPSPYTVRRLDLRGTHGIRCRWTHARHLVRERRRLRHAQVYLCEPGPMLALMPLLAFRAFRPRRLALTFHGSEILRFHADPVTRFFTRRLVAHAEKITVLTAYTEQLLLRHFPAATPKTFRTPGALRSAFSAPPAPPRPHSPDRRLVVLTVGRLHPRKGQLQTLEALKNLPPDLRSRLEYRLVGTASRPGYENHLRAAASTADFPVTFLGDVPDAALENIYAAADLFALTSLDHGHSVEGFGLVYLEASARGLPIVAHHVGGVPEAVENDLTGLLVQPHRPAELAAAFARLLTDAPLRARLGAAGPAWARRHTWEHSARLLFGTPADAV